DMFNRIFCCNRAAGHDQNGRKSRFKHVSSENVPTAHLFKLKDSFRPVSGLTTCFRLHPPSHPVTVALSTAQLFTVAGAALDLHQIPVYLQLLCSTRKSGSIWSRVQFTPSRQNVNRWLDGQKLVAEVFKLERLSQLAGA